MFFDLYFDQGVARYVSHFPHRQEGQLCGEIGPTYFDVEVVPSRIHQMYPECKIIVNLRNPISRTLSLYGHHLSKGRVTGSFSEAVLRMPRILSSGKYATHIPRWLDAFGAGRVTFVLLDDIKANPVLTLKHLYNFLGIADIDMPSWGNERFNELTAPRFPWLAKVTARLVTSLHAKGFHAVIQLGKALGLRALVYEGGTSKKPELTENERSQLLKEYEPDIAFVERLLNRDLSEWRKT